MLGNTQSRYELHVIIVKTEWTGQNRLIAERVAQEFEKGRANT